MLGQPYDMLTPDVVGVRLTGRRQPGTTATDVTLAVVELLRTHGVVGKFVEFTGPGLASMSLPDRATIADTVTATLTGVTTSPTTYSIGSPASATVTVTDDDQSTATIEVPDAVDEGSNLTIRVRMNPALAAEQTVKVAVLDKGPDPLYVNDYMPTFYMLTFNAGATSQTDTHPVAVRGAADARITVGIFNPVAGDLYVLGNPYTLRVDVD